MFSTRDYLPLQQCNRQTALDELQKVNGTFFTENSALFSFPTRAAAGYLASVKIIKVRRKYNNDI